VPPAAVGAATGCTDQRNGAKRHDDSDNKIKVIKRMAHGFRDDEYFFLKIRAAFPGITSEKDLEAQSPFGPSRSYRSRARDLNSSPSTTPA
jgi:hypothetical protein